MMEMALMMKKLKEEELACEVDVAVSDLHFHQKEVSSTERLSTKQISCSS